MALGPFSPRGQVARTSASREIVSEAADMQHALGGLMAPMDTGSTFTRRPQGVFEVAPVSEISHRIPTLGAMRGADGWVQNPELLAPQSGAHSSSALEGRRRLPHSLMATAFLFCTFYCPSDIPIVCDARGNLH